MDVAPDGTWLVAVREDHRGEGEARNEIVRIDTTTGDETVLVTGPDFVASPRLDGLHVGCGWPGPSGTTRTCPGTPPRCGSASLDGTELDGRSERLAGGPGEWASQPTWADGGACWLTSDRTTSPAGTPCGSLRCIAGTAATSSRSRTTRTATRPAALGLPDVLARAGCRGSVATRRAARATGFRPRRPRLGGPRHGSGDPGRDRPLGALRDQTQVEIAAPHTAVSSLVPAPGGLGRRGRLVHQRTGDRGRTAARTGRRPAAARPRPPAGADQPAGVDRLPERRRPHGARPLLPADEPGPRWLPTARSRRCWWTSTAGRPPRRGASSSWASSSGPAGASPWST